MLRVIELQNICSYVNELFEFADGVNIIVGPNASGKTNLLEAISMMAQGSSFKSTDDDMVYRDSQWGRIDATLRSGARTVKIHRNPLKKEFIIDDIPKKRLSHQLMLPIVLFEPNHMLLLGGEPERRRSYVDGVLSQIKIDFRKTVSDYKRALIQRNRLLKKERVAPEHMFVWDVRLSELAGQLVTGRALFIEQTNKSLTDRYRSISGGKETLELYYDSKLPQAGYTDAHLKKLKDSFELDRIRGYTGSGPHRDDVGVLLDGNEARSAASRGETRSVLLALKITELARIKEAFGVAPLLLLDDVFSELDGRRRRHLAATLEGVQTFITTTDADAIVKSYLDNYHIVTTRRHKKSN